MRSQNADVHAPAEVRRRLRARPRRLLVGLLAALASLGCARSYVPSRHAVVRSPDVNAAATRLHLSGFSASAEVDLRLGARPGTLLNDARFARLSDAPCERGVALRSLTLDGVEVPRNPADVAGVHTLGLGFSSGPGAPPETLEHWSGESRLPATVDLDLTDAEGRRSCVRVPLVGAPDAPAWRMSDTSPGLMIGLLGRVYPSGIALDDDHAPVGAFVERLGVAFERYRLWPEFSALGTGDARSNHLAIAAAGDVVVDEWGPWALRLGAAYDVVVNAYRADDEREGTTRYVMHGPRFSVALGLALLRRVLLPQLSTHRELPAGQRTLALELEAPFALWFGTGDAPSATFVPGVGLGMSLAL